MKIDCSRLKEYIESCVIEMCNASGKVFLIVKNNGNMELSYEDTHNHILFIRAWGCQSDTQSGVRYLTEYYYDKFMEGMIGDKEELEEKGFEFI